MVILHKIFRKFYFPVKHFVGKPEIRVQRPKHLSGKYQNYTKTFSYLPFLTDTILADLSLHKYLLVPGL